MCAQLLLPAAMLGSDSRLSGARFPLHPGSIWGYEGAGRYLGHSSHMTHPRLLRVHRSCAVASTETWTSGVIIIQSTVLHCAMEPLNSLMWTLSIMSREYNAMVMVYTRRDTNFSLSTSVCVLTQHLAVAGHRVGGAWAGFHKITVPHTRYWLRWGCGRTWMIHIDI